MPIFLADQYAEPYTRPVRTGILAGETASSGWTRGRLGSQNPELSIIPAGFLRVTAIEIRVN